MMAAPAKWWFAHTARRIRTAGSIGVANDEGMFRFSQPFQAKLSTPMFVVLRPVYVYGISDEQPFFVLRVVAARHGESCH